MLSTLFIVLIFLFSAIIHEVAHGWAASLLGDDTARYAGRLTLNPLRHLDPIGSVFLPLMLILLNSRIIFGWAKPVPVNPLNFRDQKYGEAKVAFAGPAANLILALLFGLAVRIVPWSHLGQVFDSIPLFFSFIVWVNLLLAVFNLIPIPPLDGSHILFTFLPSGAEGIKRFLLQYGFFLLVFFLFFLFPIIVPIINFLFKIIVGYSFI